MSLIGVAKVAEAAVKKSDDAASVGSKLLRNATMTRRALGLRPQKTAQAASKMNVVSKLLMRNDADKIVARTMIGVGAVAGVASGVRGTFRDINRSAGNPIGYASGLGIRGAFSGNPQGSRTKRGGASGNIPLNMR